MIKLIDHIDRYSFSKYSKSLIACACVIVSGDDQNERYMRSCIIQAEFYTSSRVLLNFSLWITNENEEAKEAEIENLLAHREGGKDNWTLVIASFYRHRAGVAMTFQR